MIERANLGVLASVALLTIAVGCNKQKEAEDPGQGPMEEAGETVDEAAEEVQEEVEDVVDDDVEAGDDVGETTDGTD